MFFFAFFAMLIVLFVLCFRTVIDADGLWFVAKNISSVRGSRK